MVICPVARMVHCTGCILVKFCPAKTILGDYGKAECSAEKADKEGKKSCDEKSADMPSGER